MGRLRPLTTGNVFFPTCSTPRLICFQEKHRLSLPVLHQTRPRLRRHFVPSQLGATCTSALHGTTMSLETLGIQDRDGTNQDRVTS